MCYQIILILDSKTMNTTAGPSIKNKRKNISNSLSGGKKPRSITRKNLCEYVNLENSVQFNDTLTVEDIVQTIQEPSEDELSEDQEQLPNISPSEALCALDKLVLYLDQNQENYSYDTKSLLRNLRWSIDRQVIETRKQSSISQYFHRRRSMPYNPR